MILTGQEIVQQRNDGRLTIDPFEEHLVNPNSYNYRLGDSIKLREHFLANPEHKGDWTTVRLPESGFVLQPKQLYLGHTLETIGSTEYVTSLIGRSSVGRLGLFLQLSADLAQIGQAHQWTLELTVVQPVRVYPNMVVGQVSFWKPEGERILYEGRYLGTNLPTSSLLYLDHVGGGDVGDEPEDER